jgi:hypothetical protein
MSIFKSSIAVLATACLAASAQAQLDPPVFSAGPDTTTRFNVNATSTTYPTGRPDATAYAPVYVTSNGGSQLRLNQASVGIRRVGSVATPAVAVTVEVTILEMTFDGTNYNLGNVIETFTQDLAASTTSLVQVVSKSWGDADPTVRPVVNLQTITNGANGYAGFWVGVRFTGAGSSSSTNGWRVVTEPVLGRSNNNFGINDPTTTGWGANFYFGTTVGTDGVTRENQARFSVNVNGLVTDSVTPPPTLVYGKIFETGAYWLPTDALDGVGSRWFYNSAFVAANVGDALTPNKVSMDVYRGGTALTPAPAIGVELALVKMTWDAVAGTYGVGDVVATQTFQLAASDTAKTDRIDWTWSNPATAPVVALNTDNPANANIGGMWVGARFLGDSDALLGNNGPITGFNPAYGGSFNSFLMDNGTGVLATYTFNPPYTWTPAATGVVTFYNRPSRFMVEAFGVVGPNVPPPPACPADLNLDNVVNGADLGLMLGAWGPCPSSPCAADLNLDGVVNGADLGLMLGSWGNCPV